MLGHHLRLGGNKWRPQLNYECSDKYGKGDKSCNAKVEICQECSSNKCQKVGRHDIKKAVVLIDDAMCLKSVTDIKIYKYGYRCSGINKDINKEVSEKNKYIYLLHTRDKLKQYLADKGNVCEEQVKGLVQIVTKMLSDPKVDNTINIQCSYLGGTITDRSKHDNWLLKNKQCAGDSEWDLLKTNVCRSADITIVPVECEEQFVTALVESIEENKTDHKHYVEVLEMISTCKAASVNIKEVKKEYCDAKVEIEDVVGKCGVGKVTAKVYQRMCEAGVSKAVIEKMVECNMNPKVKVSREEVKCYIEPFTQVVFDVLCKDAVKIKVE